MRGAIDSRLLLRTAWTPGPECEPPELVRVEVTIFHADARRDLPGIFRSGMQLRDSWPELEGAVGMWLWAKPLSSMCGSVSAWKDHESLLAFVARPDHLHVMRKYRRRGHLTSASWQQEWEGPSAIWQRAAARLRTSHARR
jgi:hypothetical protein